MADNKLPGKNRKNSFAPRQTFALICLIGEGRFSVSEALREFGIFRSSFYKWRRCSTFYQSGRRVFGVALLREENWGQNFPQQMFEIVVMRIAGKTPLYFSNISLKNTMTPLLCSPIAIWVKHPPGSYSLESEQKAKSKILKTKNLAHLISKKPLKARQICI